MGDVLHLWEQCRAAPVAQRALSLLAAAYSNRAFREISIGEGDALLLRLRAETFGDEVNLRTTCPHCGCAITGSMRVHDLLVEPRPGEADPCPAALEVESYRLQLRVPTLDDLQAAGEAADVAGAVAVLQLRCIISAERDGQPVDIRCLPPPVVKAVSERLAELDPRADLTLRFTCPECGQDWRAPFDVAEFLWEEIASEAPRLLRQVHALARAYGWRESDILAMSTQRRQIYLELIDAG